MSYHTHSTCVSNYTFHTLLVTVFGTTPKFSQFSLLECAILMSEKNSHRHMRHACR